MSFPRWRRRASLVVLTVLTTARPARPQTGSNLVYTAITPCRIADTRPSQGGTGALAANETRTFHVVGSTSNFAGQGGMAGGCSIPGFSGSTAQVQAVMFNFVAVTPTGAGDLRAWPADQPVPNASILNYQAIAGLNIANGIVIPVRQDLEGSDLSVRADVAATHVVIDVVGFFSRLGTGNTLAMDANVILYSNSGMERGLNFRRAGSPELPTNPEFRIGRITRGGDGSPEFRVLYHGDDVTIPEGEWSVFEFDAKGIVASVKPRAEDLPVGGGRGSHFEGFIRLDDQPLFRLNSYPEMQLEMGPGGSGTTNCTDVALRRVPGGGLKIIRLNCSPPMEIDQVKFVNGDVAISMQGSGVVLHATDGANCFRLTVNNSGTLATAPVPCP